MRKRKANVLLDGFKKSVIFEIVDTLPEVGDFYDHEEITEIFQLELCVDQPYSDNCDYVFCKIHTTFNGEVDEEPMDIFLCCLSE